MAFQDAYGTVVDDFTTAKTRAIWSSPFMFDPQIVKDDYQGSTGSSAKRKEGRFTREVLPIAQIRGGATPKNIEWLLRSWGGTWSGGGTLTFAMTEAINEFMTLGIVEKVPPGVSNGQKLVRVWDGWTHRLEFILRSGLSVLEVTGDVAARDYDETDLDALGGISLPLTAAGYMPPAIDVFAPHGARLYRDPAGVNVSIAIEELSIVMEHGLNHETWNDANPQVIKEGPTAIRVRLRSRWMDETYGIQGDAATLVPTFKRFRAEFAVGAKSFVIDMKNVDFQVSPTGWHDGAFREYEVTGEAMDDGAGNYVDITLTP